MSNYSTNRFTKDYIPSQGTGYGQVLIQKNRGPPPPMLTKNNPNVQGRRVTHPQGTYANEQRDITSINSYPENLNGQRPMPIVDPTYDQFIVKPPRANVTQGIIPDVLFVSSEDRNYDLYPDESDYVVQFKDEYKNVISVTLVNANIPNTAYLINKNNNKIYFKEEYCTVLTAEVPVGDYSPTNLATALQTAMNSVGSSTYAVTLDTTTNKYSIASDLTAGDNIFNLLFNGGTEPFQPGNQRTIYPVDSIGKIIGYPRENFLNTTGDVSISNGSAIVTGVNTEFTDEVTVGSAVYFKSISFGANVLSVDSDTQITLDANATGNVINGDMVLGTKIAPFKYDLRSDPYIVLEIPELENIRSNAPHIDRAFAVIPIDTEHNSRQFIVSARNGLSPYKKYFNPPLARLDRLTIRFRNTRGNLIDFEGIDNFLEFRVLRLNAQGFYDPGSVN